MQLRRFTKRAQVVGLILGAADTQQPGWFATDADTLDLLSESDWTKALGERRADRLVAEHVWEHLVAHEAQDAAARCFRYLNPGGYLRVAVPDGLHPHPSYIASVRPGGSGVGARDHHVLYDYRSLSELFNRAGFQVRLLEFFDEEGTFHYSNWEPRDGMIRRSTRFDPRNAPEAPLTYTSLIVDAIKPEESIP